MLVIIPLLFIGGNYQRGLYSQCNRFKQLGQFINISDKLDFSGKYIVALSDADYLASTYSNGKLPKDAGIKADKLSVIPLPLSKARQEINEVDASNSVTAAPFALSTAPDGRTAFVVETLKPALPGMTRREQLQPGNQLVAVDLSMPNSLGIKDSIEISSLPGVVDVHPDGELLVITTETTGKEVVLVPWENGRFGKPLELSLQALGIEPDPSYYQNGMKASYVEWHPSGRYLAINLHLRDEVLFFELQQDDGHLKLSQWGDPIKVGKDPYSGKFTPDGLFYITSNWGRNFGKNVTTIEERIPTARGTLSVISVDGIALEGSQAKPHLVDTAISDVNPEGIAISPDGLLVATVNMRGTPFPKGHPRFEKNSTLSLFKLNPENGRLTKVDDYLFEGVLPESAAFDLKSNYLAVASFQSSHAEDTKGCVDIWRVKREPSLSIESTGYSIEVPRGAHQVHVVF